jgi:hypothetical protein
MAVADLAVAVAVAVAVAAAAAVVVVEEEEAVEKMAEETIAMKMEKVAGGEGFASSSPSPVRCSL